MQHFDWNMKREHHRDSEGVKTKSDQRSILQIQNQIRKSTQTRTQICSTRTWKPKRRREKPFDCENSGGGHAIFQGTEPKRAGSRSGSRNGSDGPGIGAESGCHEEPGRSGPAAGHRRRREERRRRRRRGRRSRQLPRRRRDVERMIQLQRHRPYRRIPSRARRASASSSVGDGARFNGGRPALGEADISCGDRKRRFGRRKDCPRRGAHITGLPPLRS